MRPCRAKPLILAALLVTGALVAGCGQTVQDMLPDLPETESLARRAVLTPEEAKAAAEALIRARDERQASDLAPALRKTASH